MLRKIQKKATLLSAPSPLRWFTFYKADDYKPNTKRNDESYIPIAVFTWQQENRSNT
jgi:hypothetical protein